MVDLEISVLLTVYLLRKEEMGYKNNAVCFEYVAKILEKVFIN